MRAQPRRSLRPVCEEDRPFLKKVFFTSLQRALAIANLPADQQQQFVDHQFVAQDTGYRSQFPNAAYDIILLDDEPAGRLYVDRHKDDIRLMEMTLLPRHRNQGVGTKLIQELLDEAQECGLPVVLHVEHWNPAARRLYLRLGFVDDEDTGTHWRMRWEPKR